MWPEIKIQKAGALTDGYSIDCTCFCSYALGVTLRPHSAAMSFSRILTNICADDLAACRDFVCSVSEHS